MMTVETIFYIILTMLTADNIKPRYIADEAVRNHLHQVAEAIYDNSHRIDPHRLIALAFKETRFGYKKSSLNNGVACGVYQQVPSTATKKVTCQRLIFDIDRATELAVEYIHNIDYRWGEREDVVNRMCHYYSGNRCGDLKSKIYVKKYGKAYSDSREAYSALYSEGDDELSDNFIREEIDLIVMKAIYQTRKAKKD